MLSGFVNAVLFTATRRVIQFPANWKSRLFSFSRQSNDPEGGRMTGPYISTTMTTQVDEPDSPTAHAPVMQGPQAPLTSTSPAPFNTYTGFTATTSQPNAHGDSFSTAQSATSFVTYQGKRPQWVGHGRSWSGGSARSGSSGGTVTTRDDPSAFSGGPLVKNASAEGRSGYPSGYGRERSGSEGSIRYQAGYIPGDSSSLQRVNKALPSLPGENR